MGTWGNQCTLLVCVARSIPRGNIFLLFYYLNVNKLISFQSFAVVYPYDNSKAMYSMILHGHTNIEKIISIVVKLR